VTQTLQQVLQNTQFHSDGQLYRFVRLSANAIILAAGIVAEASIPFCALLADKDEVTLMLPEEVCQEFRSRLKFAEISDTAYRLITLDVVLEPTLVGLMALISKTLAEAEISMMSFAAYSRDHIFVSADDFEKALAALKALQARIGTQG